MDRESIISNLAIQVAIRQCKDFTPANLVDTYFSVLPEVRKRYEDHENEKKQSSSSNFKSFSAKALEI